MKLLLDANLSWRLTALLAEHYGECLHVNKTSLPKPATDTEIWDYAKANKTRAPVKNLATDTRRPPIWAGLITNFAVTSK